MRHQRPVRGGRDPLGAAVLKQVRSKVESTARRYDVSKSFVVATILARYFGIETEAPDDPIDSVAPAARRPRPRSSSRSVHVH